MIKLSTNISKKVPVPGQNFSSQQFGAAMEIEVSDADVPGVIQQRIRDLYVLLSSSVDEQIARASTAATSAVIPQQNSMNVHVQGSMSVPPPPAQRNSYSAARNRIATSNGIGNGRRVTATEAQVKCIHAICRAQGLDLVSILADFNVPDPKDLHIKDASRLIDQIKNGTAAQ